MDLTLLIMAAGMGKRFGGLKQFYPFGPNGETLLEYSIYDALQAGFNRFVCVIRPELEEQFHTVILSKIPKHVKVQYTFQRVDELPNGIKLSVKREKPWGTGHTIWSTRHLLNTGPFCVINADDFYGRSAFKLLSDFFNSTLHTNLHTNVTFPLKATVSPHGAVSRGVCALDAKGEIQSVKERTRIYLQKDNSIVELDTNEKTLHTFTGDEPVSVNCWGFWPAILPLIDEAVNAFFKQHHASATEECLLPAIVDHYIQKHIIHVKALQSSNHWIGVTYPEDIDGVKEMLVDFTKDGTYPNKLWKS